MFKTCRKCCIEKLEADFYRKSLKSGGGLEAVCKECRKASMKVQRATIESFERRKVTSREYYFRNKAEVLERQRLRAKSDEVRAWHRSHYLANRDKILQKSKEYGAKNPEVRAAWARRKRANSPEFREMLAMKAMERRKAAPEKAKRLDREWRLAHPHKVRAKNVRRKATKLQAIPKWATESGIKAIYKQANQVSKLTGIKHHVDHIVPLKSNLVCGLHVENNLQVIQASANFAKSNKFWPDMP